MTKKKVKGESPKGGVASKGARERTPSVRMELDRLKHIIEKSPAKKAVAAKKVEKHISKSDSEITPTALVIAANAIILEEYGEKNGESKASYEQEAKKSLPENIKMIMSGMIADVGQLLENYRFRIYMIEKRFRKRVKYLWRELPKMTTALRTAAKHASSTVVGGTLGSIPYFLLRDYMGHWGAAAVGAVVTIGAYYLTSKWGAKLLSEIALNIDYGITALRKMAVCSYYSGKKVKKLETLGRVLKQEMSTDEKQHEVDKKTVKSVGKTMPSPFEIVVPEEELEQVS